MPDHDDQDKLLQRLRADEPAAFEELVRTHGGRMLAVARRMLTQEQDAQDAVQDAFLSAFKAINTFAGDALLSTWLHRITVNAALMKLRTRRRKPERPIADMLPRYSDDGHRLPPEPADDAPASSPMEQRELRDQIRQEIDRLPETYRNVLMLRDIEGLDTKEAAHSLNVSQGVVKTRLHRARQALREALAPQMEALRP